MSGSENEVVFARLKSLQDTIKGLKSGKNDATVLYVVQEVVGFLTACSSQEVITVAIKVLEDAIVVSPQAGTILRLEGGLKQVIKHLKASTTLPAVAGPAARILAVAGATSTVTQTVLAKEKGLGLLLLNTCALHMRDPAIAGPLCETMAHMARAPKGAIQLESDGLLPVMQELLVSYLGNWPVFGWALKLMKNLAKFEYTQNGAGTAVGTGAPVARGASGVLTTTGEGVRMLLGVARVLARIPEQRKLLKRVSRTLWLLCPHVLVPLPRLEPLVPLPPKDSPHLMVSSAAEADSQRHVELFPEEYPGQQVQQQMQTQPQPPQMQFNQQQPSGWPGGTAAPPCLTIRPPEALPARPPSARQTCRSIAAPFGFLGSPVELGPSSSHALGQTPEPFHGYGSSLDCEMMLHDLQRIANPRGLVNRIVFMNASPNGSVAGSAVSSVGLNARCSSPSASLRESVQPPLGPRSQSQAMDTNALPWSDPAARIPEGRTGSGIFPDLSRLGLTDTGNSDSLTVNPGPLPTVRTGSMPDLDPFHLPQIIAEPGSQRLDGATAPSGAHRLSGRFASPGSTSSGTCSSARPPSPPPPPLTFHSGFESGNLRCAAQVGPREYDLFLAPDLNDRSEGGNLCQWFYFAVTVPPAACSGVGWPLMGRTGAPAAGSGTTHQQQPQPPSAEAQASADGSGAAGGVSGGTHPASGSGLGQGPGVKMNIVNLRKKESLFSVGKRPVICLVRPAEGEASASASASASTASTPRSRPGSAPYPATDPGVWFRAGSHISYYPSPYRGRPTVAGEGAASRKGKKPSAAALASSAASAAANAGGGSGAGGAAGPAGGALASTSPSPGKKSKSKVKAAGGTAAAGDGMDGEAGAPSLTSIGPGLYCATFTLHFPVPGTYYVASCYPYTYTDLQDYLAGLQRRLAAGSSTASGASGARAQQQQQQQQLASPPPLVRSLLCYTLTGLRVDLLTITDWSSPVEMVRQRECIFITARVHPGETCASWLMQGILEFLCSSDPAAVTLRSSFVFKLVPMLNPDGVVNGSYRCNLAGVDLNRVWDRPIRFLYPTVYHSKRVLQQLAAAGRLALYIDIHGHSTKSDTFFYGCEPTPAALQAHAAGNKDQRGSGPAANPATNALSYGNGRPTGFCPMSTGGDVDVSPQFLSPQHTPPQLLLLGPYSPGTPCAAAGPAVPASGLNVQGNGYGGNGTGGAGGGALPQQGATGSGSAAPPTSGPSARVAARLRVRMLPYLTARTSSDFSFPKCSFKIRKAKLSAARVVVHRELGVAGSYTLEASLAGCSSSGAHYSARDYLVMGHNLCRAICELAEVDDAALLEEMNARVTLPPL